MKKTNIIFSNPDEPFYFSHQQRLGHYDMPSNHFHDKYELYYLLSGERYYFVKDKVLHIRPGNLVLINKNDLHKTIDAGTEAHTRTLINFDKNFILPSLHMDNLINELFTENNRVIPFLPVDRQYIESCFDRMAYEIEHKSIGFEISLQLILMELLVYARRYMEDYPTPTPANPSPMHKKVSEIAQYVNDNYSAPLSLSSVSQKFFISQYYLSRTFKETTGFTFIEYLNSIRVRQAQLLLLETNDPITIIAEKVGFGNISHFGRVFKAITKVSPMAFRKQHK